MEATEAQTQPWFSWLIPQCPVFLSSTLSFPISFFTSFSASQHSSTDVWVIFYQQLLPSLFFYLLVFVFLNNSWTRIWLVPMTFHVRAFRFLINPPKKKKSFPPWSKVQGFEAFFSSVTSSIPPALPASPSPFLIRPYILSSSLSSLSICVSPSTPFIPLSSVQLYSNPGRQQDLELTGEMRWWNGMTSVVWVRVCVCVSARAHVSSQVCVCSMTCSSGSN